MAKIFKPRRASRDKINTDTSIKLDDGELMFVKKEKTNPKSSFDIYIGNTGLDPVKNMKPALYGDTAEEPMSYVDDPPVTTTSQALALVRAGRSFGQTIGALKKAIELYRVEQDTWYTAPNGNFLPTVPTIHSFFKKDFENFDTKSVTNPIIVYKRAQEDDSRNLVIRYDNDIIDGYESPNRGKYYLDISNITNYFSEIMIKATIITAYGTQNHVEIVLPIGSLPKDRIYNFLNPNYDPSIPNSKPFSTPQSFRNGYTQGLEKNDQREIIGIFGGEVAFKIYRERIYFDTGYVNGSVAEVDWAFCWKERN